MKIEYVLRPYKNVPKNQLIYYSDYKKRGYQLMGNTDFLFLYNKYLPKDTLFSEECSIF